MSYLRRNENGFKRSTIETIGVVISPSHSGFCLSKEAKKLYEERTGNKYDEYSRTSCRHDSVLVDIVKELGVGSHKRARELTIENIPWEFKDCYKINEYDGAENIDLSSHLLVGHMLTNMNIESLTPEECKDTLLDLQKKMATNYYL